MGPLQGSYDKLRRLELKIEQFGDCPDPVFIGISIRSLRGQRSEATNVSRGKIDPLTQGEQDKERTYQIRDPQTGRLNIKAKLYPLIISPWGGLSPKGTEFFDKLEEVVGRRVALRDRRVLAIEVVKTIAYKLRSGAGFTMPEQKGEKPTLAVQPSGEGDNFSNYSPSEAGKCFAS